ncbi:MAG: penicillin acylase family protein [Bacteroidetes bacterium]|nr:penicillin acylase family protein [Bacteroidota bacterium]
MRIFLSILTALITIALCIVLNTRMLLPAPLGALLSPQHGIWQNADNSDFDFSDVISNSYLKSEVNVYLDSRLVPHVFAANENDAYFVQGYLHAKFRLWQMELQTLAAAGRASEIVGEAALDHDREFRRLGMVYAAEKSVEVMESDPILKAECDAYTAGVNYYISKLTYSKLPLEYKIIGYFPEKWSNLKTALFLKYMSYDLAARENDFELTKSRSYFNIHDYKLLFPPIADSLDPIIPGKIVDTPQIELTAPVNYDSINFADIDVIPAEKPDRDNGSNNWAVAGSKTNSGATILCNDPHLGLNLPSLWFEMQITTPEFNAYGVSFPGSPSIIIGFNDSIAWGVTNGGRDVRDYYEINFNEDKSSYFFDSVWTPTDFRIEKIKIKGKSDFTDTVAYTRFGPVMYDNNYHVRSSGKKAFAVKWSAHEPGKELLTFNLLNRAKNYSDYLDAIGYMHTPGQNFAFASRSGDIAMRTAGSWPAKWNQQGDFLMPGNDSSYMWQGIIPKDETPYQYNPDRGFVSSANQRPADSAYPYYLGMDYPTARGFIINRMLREKSNITIEDMKKMQTDNYNVFAEMALPILINNMQVLKLTDQMQNYFSVLKNWDKRMDVNSKGATIFDIFWDEFYKAVYDDEYLNAPPMAMKPLQETLLEAVLKDSAYKFIDDISTRNIETLEDVVTAAFKKAFPKINDAEANGKLEWAKYKDTRVTHLAKLDAFSRLHLPIGGGKNIINATSSKHGPSWRMIVSMGKNIEGFGVYPGGQSGNPGSKFYDNFINTWVEGQYFPLWVMQKDDVSNSNIKWKIVFKPAA